MFVAVENQLLKIQYGGENLPVNIDKFPQVWSHNQWLKRYFRSTKEYGKSIFHKSFAYLRERKLSKKKKIYDLHESVR